jgi:hypothetical protein
MRDKLIELYQENLEGRSLAVLAAVAAAIAGLAFYLDWVTEASAGMVMGAAMVIVIGSIMLRHAFELGGARRAVALTLTLLTAAAIAVPIVATIAPGEPLAKGSLRARGDKFLLPATAEGPVRLLVHAALGGQGGSSSVEYELRGTEQPVKGSLARIQNTQRVGRRGSASVTSERSTEYVVAAVPSGTHELTLHDIGGQMEGPLEVAIFKNRWPATFEWLALVALLAVLVALTGRLGLDANVLTAASVGLFFGLFVYEFASPQAVVKPEIGALILSLLVGGACGSLLAWTAKKIAPAKAR